MEEVKHSCSNLLAFDSVVDMELGMINFMISKYHKSFYFKQNVVNASSENVKKNLLLARTNKNPLTVLLNERAVSSAESMLKELKEKHMKEVLAFAKPNDILRFAKTLQQTNGVIKCFINCKNELEKQYINKLDDTLDTVMDETNMDFYDSLFIKHVEDITEYKNMGGKYIYLSNYMHNIDEQTGEPKKIILVASGYNKIRTVDPYVGLTVPKLGGNKDE